ncbi:MAG: ABC transporter ATP-binding protein [Thermomicrobiales bacterium]|nr:ABC transporter ATP-binding protein [Thermomicrobiales bacterium]
MPANTNSLIGASISAKVCIRDLDEVMRHEFTYTRDTRPLNSFVVTWALIFSFEGIVLVTLAVIVAPWFWLKLLLPLLAMGGLALFVKKARAPLATTHVVTESELILRFGAFRLAVPRHSIIDATPIHDKAVIPFTPTLTRTSDSRAQLTMSHTGQMLLHLDPPVYSSHRRAKGEFRELLINIDDSGELIRVLTADMPQTTGHPADRIDVVMSPATSMGQPMIEAIELSKRFGENTVVDDVSFTIRSGEIYGFIGRNGAGKSTTISMLAGLLAPTSGSTRIDSHLLESNPVGYKSSLGYVADTPPLFPKLTGLEHLRYTARMHRYSPQLTDERISLLVSRLELDRHIHEYTETYSLGTKRKLALAIALLHQPRALILDEPFNGLDPQTSRGLQHLISDFAANGGAVLLSSHDLNLVARLCHQIGVMDQGKLVVEGAPQSVQAHAESLEDRFLELMVRE